MADHTVNPYVGPRTFEEGDANIFFGREREARDLLSLVISEPLVLFYAQSGAGKSSVINTRLIPCLREEGFMVLPVARVGGEIPEGVSEVKNIFAFNLLLSLSVGEDIEADELTQTTISEYLQSRKEQDLASFRSSLADDGDWDDEEPARVLVIDQFEEVITTHLSRWTERGAFFEQLSEAVRNDPLLWIVLSLREDFVAALDPYARSLPGRLRARFHMERMGASAARQAVEKPAQQYGRPFAPGVAKTLVDNLRQLRTQEENQVLLGQYIEPVQLQVVCYQLWQNLKDRPPGPITQEDVNELGNVDAALSQFYEQAIANVLQQTGVSELELRNWFDRQLITEAETRGTVYQGKEETAGLDNRVVQRLANQFLLRAEIRAGGTWYELVHDRFVSPILHANQTWRLQQSPLIRAAEEWDRAGRPRNKLYQGEQLEEALASMHRDSLEPIVQRFLMASEDAQSQRDLAKTRTEMEEQRQRAESEARTAQRLRRLTFALVVIFLVAIGTAFYAIREAGRASDNARTASENAGEAEAAQATAEAASQLAATREQEARILADAEATSAAAALVSAQEAEALAVVAQDAREQAEASAEEAEEARAIADENALQAEENAAEAERLSRISLAQSLASTAPRLIDRTNNTELATLLAVESYYINRELNIELLETVDNSLREILAEPYFNVVLEGHEDYVQHIAFSADGTLLATGDSSGGLLLWELTRPDIPAQSLEGHETAVSAIVFSHDNQWLATADDSGLILLWDLNTLTSIRLEVHQGSVGQLAFTNESELVSAGEDKFVYRWPLTAVSEQGEISPTRIPGFNRGHGFLALSPDGTILVTVNALNTISLWDLTTPGGAQEVLYYLGNVPNIISIAFSADMETIAAAGAEGIIRIWDLAGGTTQSARIEAPAGVSQIALSPDGRRLVSISGELSDLDVRLWNLSFFIDDGRLVPNEGISTQLKGHTSNIRALALSLDGLRMATGGDDQTVRYWRLETSSAAPVSLDGNGSGVTSVAVSSDDNLMIGNEAGEILVWDATTLDQRAETPVAVFNGHEGRVQALLVTTDSQILVSAGDDGLIKLWPLNPMSDGPQFTLNASEEAIYTIDISPDGRFLVSGGEDSIIRFWPLADLLAGETITATALMAHEDWVDTLAFSPDGRTLASGGGETAVFLWDLGQIEDIDALSTLIPTRLSGHEDAVSSVAFSPNGRYLASGSYDTSVRLWDMDRLEAPPINLFGHDDFVFDVVFSPDSNTLASSSWDRTIDFWDIRAAVDKPAVAPITLRGHTGQVVDLVYNADGQRLISASLDGSARVWNAKVDSFVAAACSQVHRNLSWDEWERYLEGDPIYNLPCPELPVHPSFIESARELAGLQDIAGAVARFERAIELGAELNFDPETEARRLAVEGIVNSGLRRAEQGDLVAAVAAFTEAQNVDDSVTISGEQWQQLCSLGHERGETAVVLEACQMAVNLAVAGDDISLNQRLCRLAVAPELVTAMTPACDRLVELAANSDDAYFAFQTCRLQDSIDTISAVVTPVCELAASLTHTITVGMSAQSFITSGQGELWSFEGEEGEEVTIGLTADSISLDPYLILFGPSGEVIAENDDIDPGVMRDSLLEGIILPASGSYIIVARGFDETSAGAYTIRLE
jgi:WD40 repeat protein